VFRRKIEKGPFLELVEHKHDAVPGEFQGEQVGLISLREKAGPEDELTQGVPP
jgi:hypothetical protein